MNKTKIKKVISDWAKKTSKIWQQDCLFSFEKAYMDQALKTGKKEDLDSFWFKIDGFIYDAVNAVNGCDSFSFAEIFEGTGWNYEFDSLSVLLIYKGEF